MCAATRSLLFVCAVPLLRISCFPHFLHAPDRCGFFFLCFERKKKPKPDFTCEEATNSLVFKEKKNQKKNKIHIRRRAQGRRPAPTSDQSRASHSGGQLWLLQGSVRGGRRGAQAESSRTFSSEAEILLLHRTSRVRRPPLQLRLHSDQPPVDQLRKYQHLKTGLIVQGHRSRTGKIRRGRGSVKSHHLMSLFLKKKKKNLISMRL